jgi:uncharacterized RDD family membrane protein YckC
MVAGIEVTTLDGNAINFNYALRRRSVDLVFCILYIIGTLIALDKIGDQAFIDTTWMKMSRELKNNRPLIFNHIIFVSTLWFWSEVVVILFNKKRRALHDFIGGTVVVDLKAEAPSAKD